MQLREKEEMVRLADSNLDSKTEETRKIYQREMKEIEIGYEAEIQQLRKALVELDNEVKMERQIRYE